ncbi:hypothetical protein [Mycobacterium sp.]|uniref:hypothetical protein n=1 Tax=Mycobacterium sp. TaxID=1785 RepID=UPI0025FC5EB5|nr:hypothetical protein [Mycobacterium sp.]
MTNFTDGLKSPGLTELISRYDAWRSRWTAVTGNESSWGAAELLDGRLWIRDGYPYPDWKAKVIEPCELGYLVLSATTERSNSPRTAIESVFSNLDDAGKYVIVNLGDMVRRKRNIEPLYRKWQRSGLYSDLTKEPVDEPVVQFIADYNGVEDDLVRQFIHKYSLRERPDRYAYLTPADEPKSRILVESYDALDEVLTEGLERSE